MKLISFLFLLCCLSACKNKESTPINPVQFQQLVKLPSLLNESSGFLFKNETTLYSHNDSGNDPVIYDINLQQGTIDRTVTLSNANNIDWEELAEDEEYIYIGDCGNNNGSRQDLVIYKVAKSDHENAANISTAEKIEFHYPEQNDFSARSDHNFDCEAMISLGDSLYLFTKNRGNLETNLYRLSKTPGTYAAKLLTSFNVDGLLTAATVRKTNRPAIALLGYQMSRGNFNPFIWLLYDFNGEQFFSGQTQKIELPYPVQAEAICFENDSTLLFSAESENGQPAFLYRFNASEWLE